MSLPEVYKYTVDTLILEKGVAGTLDHLNGFHGASYIIDNDFQNDLFQKVVDYISLTHTDEYLIWKLMQDATTRYT